MWDVVCPLVRGGSGFVWGSAATSWVPMCIGISAPPRFVLVFGKGELGLFFRVGVGRVFLVSLCKYRCWVDFGVFEIGFVLQNKGDLSRDDWPLRHEDTKVFGHGLTPVDTDFEKVWQWSIIIEFLFSLVGIPDGSGSSYSLCFDFDPEGIGISTSLQYRVFDIDFSVLSFVGIIRY